MSELKKLLGEFDTVMLSTVTPEGEIRARPMATQEIDAVPGCDLWFVTRVASPKTHEIEHNQHVGVCCYRARDRAYLSISARARVVRDPALTRKLFKPDWKLWFPDGPDDPSMVLLELDVEHAEYWEPDGGRVSVLYRMIQSLARGESADAALGPPKRV